MTITKKYCDHCGKVLDKRYSMFITPEDIKEELKVMEIDNNGK